eukprot:3936449-Rhodomonas_salina.5
MPTTSSVRSSFCMRFGGRHGDRPGSGQHELSRPRIGLSYSRAVDVPDRLVFVGLRLPLESWRCAHRPYTELSAPFGLSDMHPQLLHSKNWTIALRLSMVNNGEEERGVKSVDHKLMVCAVGIPRRLTWCAAEPVLDPTKISSGNFPPTTSLRQFPTKLPCVGNCRGPSTRVVKKQASGNFRVRGGGEG